MIEHTEQAIAECLRSLERQPASKSAASPAVALQKEGASRITQRDLMSPRAAKTPFDRPGWLFELKYDGFRVLAVRRGSGARLLSQSGVNLAPAFPEIVECLLKLPEVVLDGELVVLDSQGKAQFDKVQRRSLARTPSSVKKAMRTAQADLLALDILELRGRDLRVLPLLVRKRVLQQALEGFQRIRPIQYVHERGKRLFAAARELDIGGIVAKRADSPYAAGESGDWLTIRRAAGGGSAGKRPRP